MRLAPGYSLTDQHGARFTSESVRGDITLYGFTGLECGEECNLVTATLQSVAEEVSDQLDFGDAEFRLVSVVVDPGSGEPDLAAVADRYRVGADWAWISGSSEHLARVVGPGFDRFYEVGTAGEVRFDPGFVIVDGNGIVRGDYRYQTLGSDADKLVRHLGTLAAEIRHSSGPAALAYEAAHLFLCYP